MRLFYSPTSPYARKVRVALAEKRLEQQVDAVACNPFDDPQMLTAANPLGKVPVLVLDDGEVLYDSPVIVEYVDSLDSPVRLIPPDAGPRWRVLRQQALGDGILDAALAIVLERRRPEAERSSHWLNRWQGVIARGLAAIESEAGSFGRTPDLGQITLGSALGYLDFRLPETDWRNACPETSAWFDAFSARPSMAATRPEL